MMQQPGGGDRYGEERGETLSSSETSLYSDA
jgi:hypothetical protein